jgi:hypothetical protein
MVTRRRLLSLCGFAVVLPFAPRGGIRVGNYARIIALTPDWEPYGAGHALKARLCVGKICRVIYIDENGRPELDVFEHIKCHFPRLTGASMSFDPNCVAAERSP